LVRAFGSEFAALDANFDDLKKVSGDRIADGVRRVQEGNVKVIPGYDGVFGVVDIFGEFKEEDLKKEIEKLNAADAKKGGKSKKNEEKGEKKEGKTERGKKRRAGKQFKGQKTLGDF